MTTKSRPIPRDPDYDPGTRLRPSSIYRSIMCRSWHKMAYGIKEDESPAATLGTQLHSSVRKLILTGELDSYDDEAPVEDLIIRCAEKHAEFLREREESGEKLDVFIEENVNLYDNLGGKIFPEDGAVDVVYIGDRIYIRDWKFYHGEHDASAIAEQLKAYYLCVCSTFKLELPGTLFAYFPRLDTELVMHIEYGDYEFEKTQQLIAAIAEERRDPDAPFSLNPTPTGCEFCPAAATCPALRAKALAVYESTPKEIVGAMTDNQKRMLLELNPLWDSMVKAAKEDFKNRLRSGEDIPFFRLQSRKGRAVIYDIEAAKRELSDYVLPEELDRLAKINPGPIVKLIAEKIMEFEGAEKSYANRKAVEIVERVSVRSKPVEALVRSWE